MQVQASIRKLADSIQTVKTVLGMKIQSEQKLVSMNVKLHVVKYYRGIFLL